MGRRQRSDLRSDPPVSRQTRGERCDPAFFTDKEKSGRSRASEQLSRTTSAHSKTKTGKGELDSGAKRSLILYRVNTHPAAG